MVGHEDPGATQRKGLSTSIATAAAEVLILIFFFSRKGCLVGVGVGGDSTGTQAPAEKSRRLLHKGGRQDVLWKRGEEGLARALGS